MPSMKAILSRLNDKASSRLQNLIDIYGNNPDVNFFAAGIWKELAHQVSIFSKVKYYRRAVESYIRAGELAPNNAKYVRKQASSYGQPSMMGGDAVKQKPLLNKIKALDPQYGFIAEMDLAQNEEKYELASQLADQAVADFPDSFILHERAAQMHWTIGNYERAQRLFLRACKFPEPSGIDRELWISSCYSVVYLTLEVEKGHLLAVQAMQRVLSVNQLITAENNQARLYLAEMAKEANEKELALATYQELSEKAVDKRIRKKARKAIKRLSKM